MSKITADTARLKLLLHELRLPANPLDELHGIMRRDLGQGQIPPDRAAGVVPGFAIKCLPEIFAPNDRLEFADVPKPPLLHIGDVVFGQGPDRARAPSLPRAVTSAFPRPALCQSPASPGTIAQPTSRPARG